MKIAAFQTFGSWSKDYLSQASFDFPPGKINLHG
jgi:hypothetical protein